MLQYSLIRVQPCAEALSTLEILVVSPISLFAQKLNASKHGPGNIMLNVKNLFVPNPIRNILVLTVMTIIETRWNTPYS